MTTTTFASISCPGCDRTSLVPVDALLVSVALEDPGPGAGRPDSAQDSSGTAPAGTVAWACHTCADLVSAPLGWRALLALVTAGATLLDEADDDEADDELPPHPESPAAGAPLTYDDLLAMHELLASGAWFDQVGPRCP
jgi:hypothetical protein